MNNTISLPYIRTPRLRLYFSLSESKWNSVKLSLHPYMSQIKDFVKRIIPKKYKKGDFVSERGRILVDDEYITPDEILKTDKLFKVMRN